jgi:hypothetical protein
VPELRDRHKKLVHWGGLLCYDTAQVGRVIRQTALSLFAYERDGATEARRIERFQKERD